MASIAHEEVEIRPRFFPIVTIQDLGLTIGAILIWSLVVGLLLYAWVSDLTL